MPVQADLVAYLDPLISEEAGTNLFEGPMPESPDNCVAITHYNSQRSDEYVMGASLTAPGYELESVQVMVRHTVMATAITWANEIHALLDNFGPGTLSGRVYSQIDSDGPPSSIGQDENGRWRFVANYDVRKERG